MYFPSNIKFLRKRRGRTQDDLAFALQLKRSTLSGYENGVAQPGIEVLVAFSGYFNISIDTLVKVDISHLSEYQLGELERGYDAYIRRSNLRVQATTLTPENKENIELVSEKAKAGYATGYADPEFIGDLPLFTLPFLSHNPKLIHHGTVPSVNTDPFSLRVTPCFQYLINHGLQVSFCRTGVR